MLSYSFQGNKKFWTPRDEEENEKIFSQQSMPTGVKIPVEIKPTYLANAEYEVEKWPVTYIMLLLRLYAGHRCLWDVGCEDNRNRKMRQVALIDIAAAMGGGVTKEQVVQKINVIRATYRYEKKRIKQRIRRGMGARTKLKWFALADAFLRKVPKKGQKNEDPNNSDSDLEDVIVFTINPESLMPLEHELSMESSIFYQENDEKLVETKIELFSDESESEMAALWDNEKTNNYESSNNENLKDNIPLKSVKLEMLDDDHQTRKGGLQNVKKVKQNMIETEVKFFGPKCVTQSIYFQSNSNQDKYQSPKPSKWNFENTLQFIELLKNHPILWDNTLSPCEFLENFAFESIATKMDKPVKSIEKRWHILRQTYDKEKQKILDNSLYKPNYKWWPQAEDLMKFDNPRPLEDMKPSKEILTESIFLQETENGETREDEDSDDEFLQNPIPSVAPLSNMNEAMESLFHQQYNDEEDLSLETNTNSTFPKENACSNSTKFVWPGLDDDLLEGKWSLKHSVTFLRLYGVHRCLWDLNDPDYRSRPLRNAAIADIAASMGHGLTSSYVAKKIKIFRITYMQQRKRILEATEKGEKPDILLKWFPLADSFLRPHIGLRSIKSDAKEMPQFDYQYVYANLNLIDPALLNDFRGKGTQNAIDIGYNSDIMDMEES